MSKSKLIFVYNANSGPVNAVLDSLHKTFSPKTYNCNLCALTYTPFYMKKKWKDFIKSIDVPVKFIYRDELKNILKRPDIQLPALLISKDEEIEVLISAEKLNGINNLNDLIEIVGTKSNSLESSEN